MNTKLFDKATLSEGLGGRCDKETLQTFDRGGFFFIYFGTGDVYGRCKQKHINVEIDAYKPLLFSCTCDSSATAIRHCLLESTGTNNATKLFSPSFLYTTVNWLSKSDPSNKCEDGKNETKNIMRGMKFLNQGFKLQLYKE